MTNIRYASTNRKVIHLHINYTLRRKVHNTLGNVRIFLHIWVYLYDMSSVRPSTWMSEVIARHPQNQHFHNNLHVMMKGMYNLLLKSNSKLASPGPDCILACWYVSILNLHNSIGIVFTCHGSGGGIAQFIMGEFPTQHPAHTQSYTVQGRAYILC